MDSFFELFKIRIGPSSSHTLDSVIKNMFEINKDKMNKYKETSQGGLAANIVEC